MIKNLNCFSINNSKSLKIIKNGHHKNYFKLKNKKDVYMETLEDFLKIIDST